MDADFSAREPKGVGLADISIALEGIDPVLGNGVDQKG